MKRITDKVIEFANDLYMDSPYDVWSNFRSNNINELINYYTISLYWRDSWQ